MYAKLIAVYALSVDDVARTVGRELPLLHAALHIEVVVLEICHSLAGGTGLEDIAIYLALAEQCLLLEVKGVYRVSFADDHDALVGIGELRVVERVYLAALGGTSPLVYLIDGKETALLAALLVYDEAGLGILTHQLVAPPGAPAVLHTHVVEVSAAKVDVFKGEPLVARLLLDHTYLLCGLCLHAH